MDTHHRNPRLERWETRLKQLFDAVDRQLEQAYGQPFPLRPNRSPDGEGITRDSDGLFDLGVSFSAGITSPHGPGYVFQVRLATLSVVPSDLQTRVEEDALAGLTAELPRFFPGLDLRLVREGRGFRLIGDLGLDRDLPPILSGS